MTRPHVLSASPMAEGMWRSAAPRAGFAGELLLGGRPGMGADDVDPYAHVPIP